MPAIAVVLVVAACSAQTRRAAPGPPPEPPGYGQWNLGIAYGSTPKQVLRHLGSPTSRRAGCWLYRGSVGRIRGRLSGSFVDAMRFCFAAGPLGADVVTDIWSHYTAHSIVRKDVAGHVVARTFYSARWGPAITIGRVPDWYLQQSS